MIHDHVQDFPFSRVLSLRYVVDALRERNGCETNPLLKKLGETLLEEIEKSRGFEEAAPDPDAFMKSHGILFEAVMSSLIPALTSNKEFSAVMVPFTYRYLFGTKSFMETLSECNESCECDRAAETDLKVTMAYLMILNKLYDFPVTPVRPLVLKLSGDSSRKERYFMFQMDMRYCKILLKKEKPVLSDDDRRRISENPTDTVMLEALLPPEIFSFEGLILARAYDVTEQEIISALKDDLLDRESIVSSSKFERIEEKLKRLIGAEDIGFALAGIIDEVILIINNAGNSIVDCIYRDTTHVCKAAFRNTIFEDAIMRKKPVFVRDLAEKQSLSPFEQELLSRGKRSVAIFPLIFRDEVIGIFQLNSPGKGKLTEMNTRVFDELIPLFTVSVKRSLDEFENQIQRIVQEKFTSIHPSVAWKFREAAIEYAGKLRGDSHPSLDEIVFENVYPLYAISDIKSSSVFRNAAIQKDLLHHLIKAEEILDESRRFKNIPILEELIFRIGHYRGMIEDSLDTGEELRIASFLKREIEPAFVGVGEFSPLIAAKIQDYMKSHDPETGVFYEKRRAFDRSVDAVNGMIVRYLEQVQAEAQEIYPHYFDKQVTDGVDQSIYLGASIAGKASFEKFYLRNMRLWQLIVLCNIAVLLETERRNMLLPLETSHLVVVQDMPITIRFDRDENRFRVGGSYNIRYEIMKKRIDKAVIKLTNERLTQPGTVSIVYSQQSEGAEYLQYVEYLQARGYFQNEHDELELEDLQGLKGLKALRVPINLQRDISREESLKRIIETANVGLER